MADFLPSRDEALDLWAANFSSVIAGAPAAVGLTIQESDTLASFVSTYHTRLVAAVEPSTRTPVSIEQKNASRSAMVAEIRGLVRRIQVFPGLSNDQRIALGITVPDAIHSPVAPPASKPILTLRGNSGRTQVVRLLDENTPTRRAKPAGVEGAVIFSYVAASGDAPPADLEQWRFEGQATRWDFAVGYNPEDVGKTAYIRALWYNEKGQRGPVSEPVIALVAA